MDKVLISNRTPWITTSHRLFLFKICRGIIGNKSFYMRNHKKILFFALVSLLFFVGKMSGPKISFVSAGNDNKSFFSKDLKFGDNNKDVRELQKMLNANPLTEVTSYGTGSPGNETAFFGALTKKAVVKFQELYADDILSPLGLKKGTGFVGIATRLKLNSLIEAGKLESQTSSGSKIISSSSSSEFESQSSSSNSLSMSQSASSESGSQTSSFASLSESSLSSSGAVFFKSGFEAPGVRVYGTSEYQIKPGATISIIGEGFAPTGNIAHIGDGWLIKDIKTDSSSSLSLEIPKDLSVGKYDIWIENENGTSKSETIKIYIVVTNNPKERPIVEKVEPREATYDSEITIYGKGFTASGNNIYSGFGNIMNISSPDGKTLKFKVSSMAQMSKLRANKNLKNIPIEISFYIANDNGYNKEPASFVIKL